MSDNRDPLIGHGLMAVLAFLFGLAFLIPAIPGLVLLYAFIKALHAS